MATRPLGSDSDSDSDYEVDFLSNALQQTQGHVRQEFHAQGQQPPRSEDATEEAGPHPAPPAKRAKVAGSQPSLTRSLPLAETASLNHSEPASDAEVTPPPTPEKLMSPPTSHYSPLDHGYATRSQSRPELSQSHGRAPGPLGVVRGGRRTRQTDTALARLRLERFERARHHRDWNQEAEDVEDGDVPAGVHGSKVSMPAAQAFQVKVRWRHAIIRDLVHPHDTFGEILQRLALQLNIPDRGLQLRLGPDRLRPTETIASRQVGVASILTLVAWTHPPVLEDPDLIELQCQTNDRRSTVMIKLGLHDPFQRLMEKYAQLKNRPVDQFRFQLDGEDLNRDDVPHSLDLEGGECIDVIPV